MDKWLTVQIFRFTNFIDVIQFNSICQILVKLSGVKSERTVSKTLFTWSGGPRSSGVGFFCFHALADTKQKKPTPLDRGPPLHVNRSDVFGLLSSRNFATMATWRNDFSALSIDTLPAIWRGLTSALLRQTFEIGWYLFERRELFESEKCLC